MAGGWACFGVLCAVVGLFIINGISIGFPGIMLGGIGLLYQPDRPGPLRGNTG